MDWINAFRSDLIDLDQDRLDLDLDLDPGSTRELLAKFAKQAPSGASPLRSEAPRRGA